MSRSRSQAGAPCGPRSSPRVRPFACLPGGIAQEDLGLAAPEPDAALRVKANEGIRRRNVDRGQHTLGLPRPRDQGPAPEGQCGVDNTKQDHIDGMLEVLAAAIFEDFAYDEMVQVQDSDRSDRHGDGPRKGTGSPSAARRGLTHDSPRTMCAVEHLIPTPV